MYNMRTHEIFVVVDLGFHLKSGSELLGQNRIFFGAERFFQTKRLDPMFPQSHLTTILPLLN